MARNTWWVTRPKRALPPVPRCLMAIAYEAQGKVWKSANKTMELTIEKNLELAGLKTKGTRRDQTGGGARTYRAWLKSLGLIFMDKGGKLWLTDAGEALVQKEASPLDVLKKQVLEYQFPSAFAHKGQSSVDTRFKVRPFIFLLQLLLDERLEGYLHEKNEIGKIVIAHGVSNKESCVDDVVNRILKHRRIGDASLEDNYVDLYVTTRAVPDIEKIFLNHGDIANTFGNWLGYTQLIERYDGVWSIAPGAEDEAREIVEKYASKPLIAKPEDEEYFQRRYGLRPGKLKDTRRLESSGSVSSKMIEEKNVLLAAEKYVAQRFINGVDEQLISDISLETGVSLKDTERILSAKYPKGLVDSFLSEYVQMAFESRDKATEFEKATTSIFADIFGLYAEHIGQKGIVPDVVIASREEGWSGILDSKAYAKGYSIGHDHRNRMVEYIERYPKYGPEFAALAFFSYVVSDYKNSVTPQIRLISEKSGVPGSVITARDIVRMVERHKKKPYTHAEIREIFSLNRAITFEDIG